MIDFEKSISLCFFRYQDNNIRAEAIHLDGLLLGKHMFMQRIRTMRKLTLQVMVLWLVSTMAPAMQQCCEVIAESLPHHDTHTQSSTDAQHAGHAHEHDSVSDIQAAEEHEHCPAVSPDTFEALILEVKFADKWNYEASGVQLWKPPVPESSWKNLRAENAVWIVNRRSIYLDTLRLRV